MRDIKLKRTARMAVSCVPARAGANAQRHGRRAVDADHTACDAAGRPSARVAFWLSKVCCHCAQSVDFEKVSFAKIECDEITATMLKSGRNRRRTRSEESTSAGSRTRDLMPRFGCAQRFFFQAPETQSKAHQAGISSAPKNLYVSRYCEHFRRSSVNVVAGSFFTRERGDNALRFSTAPSRRGVASLFRHLVLRLR
jgi:hypothetical protein